jgi:hypothetical protein
VEKPKIFASLSDLQALLQEFGVIGKPDIYFIRNSR